MLFNSYTFIFAFLPITLLVFFLVSRYGHIYGAGWLAAASLFFYAWWNPAYLSLLLGSIVFNYTLGVWIAQAVINNKPRLQGRLLFFAITANLLLLGYYKYSNFFLSNIDELVGENWSFVEIILPLGISFFTFTQIAFLVDAYQGKVKEYNFVHYCLFVTYFPHLIAGPVLHHKEMMPQFRMESTYKLNFENISVGLTIFIIGLFKKVVLADGIAVYVAPAFDISAGTNLTLIEAWSGALAYTFQIYFDFSGYSDMAIGLSRMFGITLPLNFNSPYQATNIIDFWRRWHMTLSRFLRDYLYIPLGGSRRGTSRHYTNLMVTMLLGGLWHGAGWTFVIWGGLHGVYLAINHGWHALRRAMGQDTTRSRWWGRMLARFITFMAVVVGWVFFRSENVSQSIGMLKGMMGMNGLMLPETWLQPLGWLGPWLSNWGVTFSNAGIFSGGREWVWIVILGGLAMFMPNTQQIMHNYKPALDMPKHAQVSNSFVNLWRFGGKKDFDKKNKFYWLEWQPSMIWAMALMGMAVWGLFSVARISPFLYFQF